MGDTKFIPLNNRSLLSSNKPAREIEGGNVCDEGMSDKSETAEGQFASYTCYPHRYTYCLQSTTRCHR